MIAMIRPLFQRALLGGTFALVLFVLALFPRTVLAAATWQQVPAPKSSSPDTNLAGIAGTTSSDGWVVGSTANGTTEVGLIEHWNGHAWKVFPGARVSGQYTLVGIAALSGKDAWAVGGTGSGQVLIEHWNGTAWSLVSTPTPPPFYNYSVTAVTALSSSDVWAVGYETFVGGQQSLTLHWDGTTWSVIPTPAITQGGYPANDALASVTALSSNNVWAAGSLNYGDQSLVEHWDGTAWTVVPTPVPSTRLNSYSLSSIAADSSGDLWAVGEAVGEQQSALIERWSGTAWSVVASPTPPTIGDNERASLSGVTVVSPTSAWAVGTYFASLPPNDNTDVYDALIEHWDGTAWTIVPAGPNGTTQNRLNAVASTGGLSGAVGYSQTSTTATNISALIIGCPCA